MINNAAQRIRDRAGMMGMQSTNTDSSVAARAATNIGQDTTATSLAGIQKSNSEITLFSHTEKVY